MRGTLSGRKEARPLIETSIGTNMLCHGDREGHRESSRMAHHFPHRSGSHRQHLREPRASQGNLKSTPGNKNLFFTPSNLVYVLEKVSTVFTAHFAHP
jgi:hypothetical protein